VKQLQKKLALHAEARIASTASAVWSCMTQGVSFLEKRRFIRAHAGPPGGRLRPDLWRKGRDVEQLGDRSASTW
jgi:hypothetical protein